MKLEELKELLVEHGHEETIVFESPDYASAFVGVSEEGRAIYDYDLMVQHLMDQDGMSMDDAAEFIDYNTVRALPYMPNGPILLYHLD